MIRAKTAFFHCIFIVLFLTTAFCQRPGRNTPATDQPVELVRKNIQALKGLPASQLIPVMDFFETSLGTRCGFCHAPDSTGKGLDFVSDKKEEKQTAREMIKMVGGVNGTYFAGNTAVSCYTCHRGSNRPVGSPQLPMAMMNPMEAHQPDEGKGEESLPTVETTLGLYEKALGGADAIQNIKTRIIKATLTRDTTEIPLNVFQEAPDRYAGTVTVPGRGEVTNVYNGQDVWTVMSDGARSLPGSEKVRLSREAVMFPVQRLRSLLDKIHIIGKDTADGKNAYVLIVRAGENVRERYYIDTATSLLLRRNIMNRTAVGWIPEQTDYSDYRDVDGVKIPFMVKYSYVNPRNSSIHRVSEVKQNVPLDEKLFSKPEMKK